MKRGLSCGIEYDHQTSNYSFHVGWDFEDLKKAVNEYIYGLENGTEDLICMEQAQNYYESILSCSVNYVFETILLDCDKNGSSSKLEA
jgi:hypothetical protein